MNEQNLVPMSERSQSEARELGRKGGIASGEARRERAKFRELLEQALTAEYIDVLDGRTGLSHAEKIVLSVIEKAERGDVRAFQAIVAQVGEEPVQKSSLAVERPAPEVYREIESILFGLDAAEGEEE